MTPTPTPPAVLMPPAPPPPPPFMLVPSMVPGDLVECLERLLQAAREGQLIGLAFAAMLMGREYLVEAVGEARRNPTFARGMVGALDDRLGYLMRARSL